MTDVAAEVAARAAQVDGAANGRASAGYQPPSGENAEDAYLASHDDGLGGDDDDGPVTRSDEPVTWTTEDRYAGKVADRGRDGSGRFQKKEAAPDEAAPQGSTEEAPEAATAEKVDSEAMSTALRALRRDQMTDDVIESLTDEQILKLGAVRSEAQSKFDELQAKYSRDSDPAREGTSEPGQEAAPTAEAGTNQDELHAELEAALIDGFADEEIGKTAHAALKKILDQAIGSRAPGSDANGAMTTAILARQARAGLGERFPALRTDDALWKKVEDEAQDLFAARAKRLPPGSTSADRLTLLDSALNDGARIHMGDPLSEQQRADRQAARANRSGGQPTKPQVAATKKPTPKTNEEIDDQWLIARENDDSAEMRRLEGMYSHR